MSEMTLVEAVNQALAHELAADPRVVLLGEDIGVNGGSVPRDGRVARALRRRARRRHAARRRR